MVYYKIGQEFQGNHELFEVGDNHYLRCYDRDNDYNFAHLEDAIRVATYLVADYSTHLYGIEETIKTRHFDNAEFFCARVEVWDGGECLAYRMFWIEEVKVAEGLGRWKDILHHYENFESKLNEADRTDRTV